MKTTKLPENIIEWLSLCFANRFLDKKVYGHCSYAVMKRGKKRTMQSFLSSNHFLFSLYSEEVTSSFHNCVVENGKVKMSRKERTEKAKTDKEAEKHQRIYNGERVNEGFDGP